MVNVLKTPLLEKLAKAAMRKAGGLDIREVEDVRIAVFNLDEWKNGIQHPVGMENFQQEERIILEKKIVFLFPQGVQLEKAA
jgi:hypothetical protein